MSKAQSIGRRLLSDRTFLIAGGLMLVSAIAWPVIASAIGIFLEKKPVPNVSGIEISDDYRCTSVRMTTASYEMEAEHTIDSETLDQLKIGGAADKLRRASGTSNWYLYRVYRKRGVTNPNEPYAWWQVQVYFYNGGTDTVPHVPERCYTQAGVRGIVSDTTDLPLGLRVNDWSDSVPFQRIHYEQKIGSGLQQYVPRVDYYTFSFNGLPQSDWTKVRLGMRSPFLSHAYFAKIQFGPISAGGELDLEQADREAAAFMKELLPEILKNLPSAADVKKAAEGA